MYESPGQSDVTKTALCHLKMTCNTLRSLHGRCPEDGDTLRLKLVVLQMDENTVPARRHADHHVSSEHLNLDDYCQ